MERPTEPVQYGHCIQAREGKCCRLAVKGYNSECHRDARVDGRYGRRTERPGIDNEEELQSL